VSIVVSLRRTGLAPGVAELAGNARAAWRWLRRLSLRSLVTSRVAQALALVWILVLLAQGLVAVPPGARALRLRLGRLEGPPIAPGLVYALPLADRVDLVRVDEVRELPVGYRTRGGSLERSPVSDEALYLTADENVIDLHAEVQYRVSDPVRYRLGVEKPDEVISGLTRGRLVEAMANRSIDLVYTNDRAEVEAWLLDHIRTDVAGLELGVEVLGVRLLDVHAPVNVHDAFRDIASAAEDRQTTIHRANQYAVGIEAVARGEAERTVLTAQGQADVRIAEATGNASAFKALAAEHARAPRLTEDRMYIETAERVLPGVRKVIRSAKGELKGYELWLRRDATPLVFPPAAGAAPAPAPTQLPSQALPPPAANAEAPPAPNATWQQWAPEQAGEGNR
jgi:HflK protein